MAKNHEKGRRGLPGYSPLEVEASLVSMEPKPNFSL